LPSCFKQLLTYLSRTSCLISCVSFELKIRFFLLCGHNRSSNNPGGQVFENKPMLKSPFTEQLTTHLYNPGGGAMLLLRLLLRLLLECRGYVLRGASLSDIRV